LPVAVATRYLQTCLPSVGLNKELLKVNLVNLMIGLGCGAALIAVVGGWGVAASVLLSEITALALLLKFVKQKLPALKFGPMFVAPFAAASIWGVVYLTTIAVGASYWPQVLAPLVLTTPIAWWLSAARAHGKESHAAPWTIAVPSAETLFAENSRPKAA